MTPYSQHGLQDSSRRRRGQGHRRLPDQDPAHALPEGALRCRRRRTCIHRPPVQDRTGAHQAHRHRTGHHRARDQLREHDPRDRLRMPGLRGRADACAQPHARRRDGGDEPRLQALRIQRQGDRIQTRQVLRDPQAAGRRHRQDRHAQGCAGPSEQGRGPHGRGSEDVRPGIPLRQGFQDHPQDRVGPVLRREPQEHHPRHREAGEGPRVDPAAHVPEEPLRTPFEGLGPTSSEPFFYPPWHDAPQ